MCCSTPFVIWSLCGLFSLKTRLYEDYKDVYSPYSLTSACVKNTQALCFHLVMISSCFLCSHFLRRCDDEQAGPVIDAGGIFEFARNSGMIKKAPVAV